jgi:DNA-directed RNA polymerase specialized sigma24 family protein
MKTSVQSKTSADDGCSSSQPIDIEETLQRFDPYIIAQVRELLRRNPHFAHPDVLDLEVDELVQRVRIKFWHVLSARRVEYSRAYIKRIVHSEFIDMLRSKKPQRALPLPVDEEGELYQGDMLVTPGAGMSDPADELENHYTGASCMAIVIDAVLQLSPRQQHAMVCSLRDHVDDPGQFELAFNARQSAHKPHIDVSLLRWPAQKSQKRLLQSSLSAARQNLARCLFDPHLAQQAAARIKKEPLVS